MKSYKTFLFALCTAALAFGLGCKPKDNGTSDSGNGTAATGSTPTFSLAWSEYPSWSVFGVADELELINKAAGELGELEKKYGVDIELKEADYASCLTMFGAGDCDAVCITNMDALIASPTRDGVAVLPTSTSKGADACLVTEQIADIEALKQHPVYGLEDSVSQYCFARCLEEAGFDEADFQFTNQDPALAATNMQQRNESHQAIMVWNPFVLQTLKDRSDVRVLFDSSQIPGEIVDMVVIGRDSLEKPGADKFLKAVNEAFYTVVKEMESPERGDDILVALGKKFSNLGLEEMKQVVQQTVFYKTPQDAKDLLNSPEFQETMNNVMKFCVDRGLVENPTIGFDSDAVEVKLRFDASYID
jgi:NitT/TauT family transport system substrate-binding protein